MTSPVIYVNNVSFSYNDNRVLEHITFSVNQNDFVGIIGPNGSGKTTLIKLILGMLKPVEGDIRVLGRVPQEAVRFIGYVSQNTNINKEFPITVNDITLMGRLGNTRKIWRYLDSDEALSREALKQVEMWNFRNERIGNLSMGQRQRVFIARALTTDPKILILDEPTASIDPPGQTKIFDILKVLNKQLTLLIVSHNLSTLLNYVNKVACVNRQLIFHDAPHVTTEMLRETFGFSLEQICPLEEVSQVCRTGTGHRPEEASND